MKKYIIPLLIVLLCSIIVGGYYQLKKIGITNMSLNKDKPSIQKGDSVNITTQIVSEKKIIEIKYSTREPIPKGDSFTFHVTWDTLYISNIIFKDVYSPTKEEMKNGMYTLVVHPEKQLPTKYKRTIQQENHVFYLMKSRCLTSMELK